MKFHESSKTPILFFSVFFCALLFFAKPVEVKANISGTLNASDLSQQFGPNDILSLDADTTINLDSDLTVSQINAGYHNLTITGDGGVLTCTNGINNGYVTISGNYDGGITSRSLTITRGKITSPYISVNTDITISGGIITFRQGNTNFKLDAPHKVTISGGRIIIPESAIADSTDYGIRGNEIEISGENTYIEARNSATKVYSAIFSQPNGITISAPLTITTPDGGHVISNVYGHHEIVDSAENKAHYVVIRGPQQPQPQPVEDQDKGDKEEHRSKPAVVNPDTVEGAFAANGQFLPGVAMGKTKQGPAAQAVFSASRPVGWKEAYTFNIAINSKVDYSLKSGTFTILIPQELQKAGRTFAIMALDKNGKAWTFADTDTNPATVTANINVEGYAFALIYKD